MNGKKLKIYWQCWDFNAFCLLQGRNTQIVGVKLSIRLTGQVIPHYHLFPLSGDDVNCCYVVSCRFNRDRQQLCLYDPLGGLALVNRAPATRNIHWTYQQCPFNLLSLFLSPLIPHYWWLLVHSRVSRSHPTSFPPAKSALTRSRTRRGRCSHSPTRQLGRWVALLSYPNLLKLWCSHSLEKKMPVLDVYATSGIFWKSMCYQRHDRKPTCALQSQHINTKFQIFSIFQLIWSHSSSAPLSPWPWGDFIAEPRTEPRLMVAANSDGHMT